MSESRQKPKAGTLRSVGKAARARAVERQGGGKVSVDAWFPEISALQTDRSWRIAWIAEAVTLSPHRVSEILRLGRSHRAELLGAPVFVGELRPADKACLEFSAAGFKLFFERFSGRILQPHQLEWVQLFLDNRNLLLNVPPRHGKSTIFTVWIPIWLLCINRGEQILLVSKTRALAVKFCREIEFHLSTNDDLIRTFGRFAPDTPGDFPWRATAGELLVQGRARETKSGDLSIQSRGMEQQVLGMEATVVIIDDATDAKTARSPTAHLEEMRKLHEEILSRIEPAKVGGASGRAVVVGQRVDIQDMSGELEDEVWPRGENKGLPLWYVQKQKCVLDWDAQTTLWPDKFDWEEVMLTYARVGGELAFETMYQQNPRPSGSTIVRPEWLVACRDVDRPSGQGIRGKPGLAPSARVLSIDPSPTMWNASVVADVVNIAGDWGMVVLENRQWKGKGPEFKQEVDRAIDLYTPDYLIIEESSFFSWFSSEPWYDVLKRRIRLIDHHTGVNKLDIELGADSLAGDFELGKIRTPYGDELAREETTRLEGEALNWPIGRVFDTYMATWFIKWNRKKLRAAVKKSNTFAGTELRPNNVWRRQALVESQLSRREEPERRMSVN